MGTEPHTRDVALTLDYVGSPVIAYHKYIVSHLFTIATLNVARPAAAVGLSSGNCGPQDRWYCETVSSFGHPGDYLAIDVWRKEVVIAYLDSQYLGALKVARQRAGGWFLPLVSRLYS
jgi:hypothetical protein